MSEPHEIAARLESVTSRIRDACAACGRDAADVELIAVSKRHPSDAIREAFDAGQRVFGESYAQELHEKASALADLRERGLRWRFIGHLQSNKASLIAQHADAIDSVDSLKLVRRLSAQRASSRGELEVLIQLDLGQEPSKTGAREDALPELVLAVQDAPMLRLAGLMTLPPTDAARADACFQRLAELAREHDLATLSMGMSGDLEVAIARGATQVRVGTAVFGPRPK